jgi:hypothetical protein
MRGAFADTASGARTPNQISERLDEVRLNPHGRDAMIDGHSGFLGETAVVKVELDQGL